MLNEDLARAQMSARLGEAHQPARGRPGGPRPPLEPQGRACSAAGSSRPRSRSLIRTGSR
ncbi:hypothetical protein G5V59_08350 [Nocardioides sp. W3-2-3]|uniref:hypothetical protein n=1 Tax=Nocardioides convexus TaxID=2712224 RepID=UPI002418B5E1|nr:hypothetical protein [Nocardioides convexus]NHA00152.1 hypothetical protein [Nocardioides convexus]